MPTASLRNAGHAQTETPGDAGLLTNISFTQLISRRGDRLRLPRELRSHRRAEWCAALPASVPVPRALRAIAVGSLPVQAPSSRSIGADLMMALHARSPTKIRVFRPLRYLLDGNPFARLRRGSPKNATKKIRAGQNLLCSGVVDPGSCKLLDGYAHAKFRGVILLLLPGHRHAGFFWWMECDSGVRRSVRASPARNLTRKLVVQQSNSGSAQRRDRACFELESDQQNKKARRCRAFDE